jgi:D-3-phosphoglycerate dehydrogenase
LKVLAYETSPDPTLEGEIELVDFSTLLGRSDYVSIHCPLNDQTRGLFDAEVLSQMKPGSILINTARGPIVDEAALVAALRSGHLAGAGLDVFEQEPPAKDNPLFELDNVALSPHLAGTDLTSLEGMGLEAAQCIIDLFRGHWPEGAVINDELRTRWQPIQ